MDETSLDEFAASETERESEAHADATDESDTDSGPACETEALDDVEPATVTARAGSDEECSECSEPAPRLWNDDGQFVCGSCKEW